MVNKSDKPLLLITRPEPDASAFAAACAARGIATHLEPLLTVVPIPLSADARAQAHSADTLVITSRNALPALSALQHKPLVCVGEDTTRLAREAGFTQAVFGGRAASELAATLTRDSASWPNLFYARGEEIAFPLAEQLRSNGITVSEAVTYQAVPMTALSPATTALLASGVIRAISLFSARTARICAALLNEHLVAQPPLAAFCISPATAAPLTRHPLFRVHTASQPTAVALLNLIDSVVKSH